MVDDAEAVTDQDAGESIGETSHEPEAKSKTVEKAVENEKGETKTKQTKGRKKKAEVEAEAPPPKETKIDTERSPNKRIRTQIEFFKPEEKPKTEFKILQGKGTKLGELPNVHYKLSKIKGDDELVPFLHSLLYKRNGSVHERKRNIYEFSGWAFEDEVKEKARVLDKLGKVPVKTLDEILDVMDLPRGTGDDGKKEGKINRLYAFLESPRKMSDRDLSAEESKKSKKGKVTKRKSLDKKASSKKQEATKGKRKREEEEEEDGKEEPTPKKKASTPKKALPAKEMAKPAAEKKTKPKKEVKEDDDDEDDDQPIAKIAGVQKVPTDDVIQERVMTIMSDADIETLSMKNLMEQLTAELGTLVKEKKPFIRELVMNYVQKVTMLSEGTDGN